MTSRSSFGILILAALFVTAPAFATSIPVESVRVDATCEGYTISGLGEFFDPGEILPVEYRITLDALTPGNEPVVAEGVITLDATGCVPEPGRSTCDLEFSEFFTWTETLGAPLPCGDYQLNTFTDGSCEGKPSRYIWTSPATGEVFCERLFNADTWDGFLSCPCDEPGVEICRSPGFWGTHGGTEKNRSENIVQAVIDAALMDIEVCGQPIDTTVLGTSSSALEGICVSPAGDQQLKLVRDLTSAALNCVATNGNGDCFDVSIEGVFAECNLACEDGDESAYSECIDALDCFNNGGILHDNGFCQLGTCASDDAACGEDSDCGLDELGNEIQCLPLEGNCHDRPLVNEELGLDFDPPGPAGSSHACRDARKNECTVLNGCTGSDDDSKDKGKGKGNKGGHGKGGKGGKK